MQRWVSRAGRRRFVLLAAVVAGIAAITSAGASARRPQAASPSLHRWGGMWVQSLDARPATVRAAPSSASDGKRSDQAVSNESTFTRWAYVAQLQAIYQHPSTSSRKVSRLHWYTEDNFDEVYLLLRTHWDTHGQEWVQLRIPARPNGQTGWVRRNALGAFHLTHALVVVDRGRLRMSYYYNGHKIWSAPVGVGKPGTPTPAGHFWVRERFKILSSSSGYYPYAFGTADYSTLSDWPGGGVVGIHGPYYDASGIPGRISHGCIRLKVSDDFWIAGHIGLGTPLHVI